MHNSDIAKDFFNLYYINTAIQIQLPLSAVISPLVCAPGNPNIQQMKQSKL